MRALFLNLRTTMANRIISQTTPVKQTKPPAINREQMSDIVDRTGYLMPSVTFSTLRLHKPPNPPYAAILKDKELLRFIKQFRSIGQTSYDLVAQMLNRASLIIKSAYTVYLSSPY